MSAYRPVSTSTLLDFWLWPDRDPPQATKPLDLRFDASKRGETGSVYCDRLSFHFDVDDSCSEESPLTCTGTGINTTVTPDGVWHLIPPEPDGNFTFIIPDGAGDEVTRAYTFDIFNIVVSSVIGVAEVTVTEHSTDHDRAHCPNEDHHQCYKDRVATFRVPKFPKGFGEVTFQADYTAVEPGGTVTLSWRGDPQGNYKLFADDTEITDGITETTFGWSYTTDPLSDSTIFKLRVSYQLLDTTVKHEYLAPIHVLTPILILKVKRGGRTTICSGEPVTLTWQIANVTNCSLKVRGAGVLKSNIDNLDPRAWEVTPTKDTRYYLTGTTVSGDIMASDDLEIDVVPPAPPVLSDLVFIKTANTDSGNVEVHVNDGLRGYQQRFLDVVTRFDATHADGTWTIGPWPDGCGGPLVFFQRNIDPDAPDPDLADEEEQTVQVKVPFGDFPREFELAYTPRQEDCTWVAALMTPLDRTRPWGALDFVCIQTANTDSGNVEVSYWSESDRSPGGHRIENPSDELLEDPRDPWISTYPASDGPRGFWLLADMERRSLVSPPDLVFIQTAGTDSNHVELSYARGARQYSERGGHWVTDFETADAGDGTWLLANLFGPPPPGLVYVKTNTASGRIEVNYALAANSYKNPSDSANPLGGCTGFKVAECPNGTWLLARSGWFRPQSAWWPTDDD